MTPEELRTRQFELFTAMLDGKQIQFQNSSHAQWLNISAATAIMWLLSEKDIEHVRIKPDPAKLWVGFSKGNSEHSHWVSTVDPSEFDNDFRLKYNWKLVEEDKQ